MISRGRRKLMVYFALQVESIVQHLTEKGLVNFATS